MSMPPSNNSGPPMYGQQGPQQPQAQQGYMVQPQYTGGYPQVAPQGVPLQTMYTNGDAKQEGVPQQPQYAQVTPQQTGMQQYGVSQQSVPQQGVPQQGVPQQGVPQQQPFGANPQYASALPLAVLGQGSAPVDCPVCRQRGMTMINLQAGNTTHAWALGFCIFLGLGCIPYLMSSTKDVRHNCGRCGALLATWHRSGRTVVHAYS